MVTDQCATDVRLCYLDQFLLRPDLDGLHLLGRLRLDAIGVQKHLQSRPTHTHTHIHKITILNL